MRKIICVLLVLLFVGLSFDVPASAQEGPLLTPDNLSTLSLTSTVNVGDIANLKFNSDGRYILIQDALGILVMYDQQADVLMHNLSNAVYEYVPASDGFVVNTYYDRLDITPADQFRPTYTYLDPPLRFGTEITALAYMEEERVILVGTASGEIYSYDYDLPPVLKMNWEAHKSAIREIISHGDMIVTLGDDNMLRRWNLAGQLISEVSLDNYIISAIATNGSRLVAIANEGTVIEIQDTEVEILFEDDEKVYTDLILEDDTLVASDSDGYISWFSKTELQQEINVSPFSLTSITIDPLTNYVVTGGIDGNLYWLNDMGQIVKQLFPFSEATMHDSEVSPDGSFLAVISSKFIRLRDIQQEQWVFIKEINASSSLEALSFSSDGRWLAGVDADGIIHVWDIENSLEYHAISTEVNKLASIQFIDQTTKLAIYDLDKRFEVWDVETSHQVAVLQTEQSQNKFVAHIASRGNLIVTIHNTGAVNYWLKDEWRSVPVWRNTDMEMLPIDVEFGYYDWDLYFLTRSPYRDYTEIASWVADGVHPPRDNIDTGFPEFSQFELVQESNVGVFLDEDTFVVGFWNNTSFALRHVYDVAEETRSLSVSERGTVVAVSAGAKVYIWMLSE